MNLANALHVVARRHADHPALLWEGGRLSYAGFEDQVARIAGGLIKRHGLKPGDRVAIVTENCPEFLAVLFGSWRAALCAVPVNAKLHPREMQWIFEQSGTALIIATPALATGLTADVPILSTASPDFARLLSAEPGLVTQTRSDDPAWIFYTSGTTGRPKGATLTHRNLFAQSMAYFADADIVGPQDVRLHAAPMSHGSGLYALPFVLRGATNAIMSGSFDPERIFDALHEYRNVSMFAAPTMVTRLTAHPRADGDVSGMKTLEIGGAPMYVADTKRAMEVFHGTLYQLYGQGESPMTITNVTKAMHLDTERPDFDAMIGSVGHARTGSEIAIVDDDWNALPAGTEGEIATRSDCVMAGYWRNTEATDRALSNGWLKTGDVGVIGNDGILTIKDRSKDMIISGGSNIYPREIEEVLLKHPDVREIAVVGTPHPEWGEEVVAFVVAAEGKAPPEHALDAMCLDSLARFKRPRRYVFVPDLPKNNYGKIVKTVLRDRMRDGSGG